MNADSYDFSDNDVVEHLVEKSKPLLCFACELEFFSSTNYYNHLLRHVSQPKVVIKPLNSRLVHCLLAGNSANTQQPRLGINLQRSPLKIVIKREPNCREPAFKVVNIEKKKGRAAMDEMIQEGHLDTQAPPSPTPSEILRQEVNADTHRSTWESLAYSFGFLAPEPLDSPANQEAEDAVNGKSPEHKEDSGASSSGEPELPETNLLPPIDPTPLLPPQENGVPEENGIPEMDSESEHLGNMEQESSDSGCEKDGSEKDFAGVGKNTVSLTPPPATPSPIGSLTILAPSALNNSVVNGSLPAEPPDGNTVSDNFPGINNQTREPSPVPGKSPGLTILSPAALGATSGASVNLLNIDPASSNPMGMLRGYSNSFMMATCGVCGDRSEDLEQHKAGAGHYKCRMSPDCTVVLFTSAAELSNHQHVTHGSAAPQASLQQLAQQVQRIPASYGVPPLGTPPPASTSPSFRVPGGITLTYPTPPSQPASPSFQGSIQARPFAMQTSPSTIRPEGTSRNSPALPAGLSRSISISPSIKSASKRAQSPVTECTKRSRPDSPDCELVDVQQKVPNLPKSISLTVRGSEDKNKESGGVANILASRGITVTPAGNKGSNGGGGRANVSAQPVTTLNLSSAVSIVPASQARSQFAVPQGRSIGRQPDRNVRPPTVDLTQDTPPAFNRRNRPKQFACQVCDRTYNTQEALNTHLQAHRSPGKLPYKCSICNAQYPTQQGLLQHKQTYHKEAQVSEMALPVVDIKHPATVQKLSSLGIRHCLVLSQLTNSSGGVFGLPIVAMDSARNPAICNLAALGASNVLSLGPAKALR